MSNPSGSRAGPMDAHQVATFQDAADFVAQKLVTADADAQVLCKSLAALEDDALESTLSALIQIVAPSSPSKGKRRPARSRFTADDDLPEPKRRKSLAAVEEEDDRMQVDEEFKSDHTRGSPSAFGDEELDESVKFGEGSGATAPNSPPLSLPAPQDSLGSASASKRSSAISALPSFKTRTSAPPVSSAPAPSLPPADSPRNYYASAPPIQSRDTFASSSNTVALGSKTPVSSAGGSGLSSLEKADLRRTGSSVSSLADRPPSPKGTGTPPPPVFVPTPVNKASNANNLRTAAPLVPVPDNEFGQLLRTIGYTGPVLPVNSWYNSVVTNVAQILSWQGGAAMVHKALATSPPSRLQLLYKEFARNPKHYSISKYGAGPFTQAIKYGTVEWRAACFAQLAPNLLELATHSQGNYVVQACARCPELFPQVLQNLYSHLSRLKKHPAGKYVCRALSEGRGKY